MAMDRAPSAAARRAGDTLWRRLVRETSSATEAFDALRKRAEAIHQGDPCEDAVARALRINDLRDLRDAVWDALAHPEADDNLHRWVIDQATLEDCMVPYHFIMMHVATRILQDGVCSERIYSEVASRDKLPDAWVKQLLRPPTPDAARVLVALRHPPPPE